MCVCKTLHKLGKMDKDLKEYMVEHGKEAEEIVKEIGYQPDHPHYFDLVTTFLPLITRHSYYLREEMAAKKKICNFETPK